MEKKDIKILIIDNMAYIRIKIEKILKTMGLINIIHAENGEKALESFRNFNPHLVIMDLTIPKIDALNLINLFLTMDSNVKIIACSETANMEAYQKALEKGASDFFTKPLNENEIISKINKLCMEKIIPSSDPKDEYDIIKKFDVNLDSKKSIQTFNLSGTFDPPDLNDLRNMIFSFQLYNYFNVILHFNIISKLNIDIKELITLKDMIEQEGGKFCIISENNELKNTLMKSELAGYLAKNKELAESLIL